MHWIVEIILIWGPPFSFFRWIWSPNSNEITRLLLVHVSWKRKPVFTSAASEFPAMIPYSTLNEESFHIYSGNAAVETLQYETSAVVRKRKEGSPFPRKTGIQTSFIFAWNLSRFWCLQTRDNFLISHVSKDPSPSPRLSLFGTLRSFSFLQFL